MVMPWTKVDLLRVMWKIRFVCLVVYADLFCKVCKLASLMVQN